MTLRDKIMDKYWLEFLRSGAQLHSNYGLRLDSAFWYWFIKHKIKNPPNEKLEDYL